MEFGTTAHEVDDAERGFAHLVVVGAYQMGAKSWTDASAS